MAVKPGADLDKALVGGREGDGKPLKLCVARHRTGWWLFLNHRGYHPGKYVLGKCNFGFAGEEVSADDFFLVALGSKLTAEGAPATEWVDDEMAPDSGTTRTAAAQAESVDAGDAAAPSTVMTTSRMPSGPSRPVSCLEGEVACHCEKISGCTLDGYCPCSN
jgi:hypothetical protein